MQTALWAKIVLAMLKFAIKDSAKLAELLIRPQAYIKLIESFKANLCDIFGYSIQRLI